MFSGPVFLDQMATMAVAQSPLFAVLLCGILLALLRLRRHPAASMLLASGLSLVLFDYAASYADAYNWAVSQAVGATSNSHVAASFLSGLVAAVAFGLIISAVFVG